MAMASHPATCLCRSCRAAQNATKAGCVDSHPVIYHALVSSPVWQRGRTIPDFEMDFGSLMEKFGGDVDFMEDILDDFVTDSTETLELISEKFDDYLCGSTAWSRADEERNFREMQHHSHRLKGTAGNLNLDGFMVSCSILQFNFEHGATMAQSGGAARVSSEWSTEVKDLVAVLQRRVQLIRDSLKKWQAGRGQTHPQGF